MISEIQNAFRRKTVLLTGHTGFKGSWLSLWLKHLGAQVVGYSLDPPSQPSNFAVCRIADRVDRHVIGDIRDYARFESVAQECNPDFVLHLAAQTVVKTGYQQPRETFDVNVTGTASVLDAVASLNRHCTVICVTSDKCYANSPDSRPFVETDPMGEREPYGASKGCTELVVNAYTHSFFPPEEYDRHGVAIASARAGNVIGGGDWTPYALIPDLVEAARKNRSVPLRNPRATRPWQHVLQTLSGYLLLASRLEQNPGKYTGGWNFGPNAGSGISVAEFSEAFFGQWGQGGWEDVSDQPNLHEAQTLALSIEKAKQQLGWEPVWENDTTIRHCVDWFKRYLEGEDAAELCIEQIQAFESDAASPVGDSSFVARE